MAFELRFLIRIVLRKVTVLFRQEVPFGFPVWFAFCSSVFCSYTETVPQSPPSLPPAARKTEERRIRPVQASVDFSTVRPNCSSLEQFIFVFCVFLDLNTS
jgi:hypothetical protein